jgi:hypothetical protein
VRYEIWVDRERLRDPDPIAVRDMTTNTVTHVSRVELPAGARIVTLARGNGYGATVVVQADEITTS